MITHETWKQAQARAREMIEKAAIGITDEEANSVEIADFGLGHLEIEGAQILTLVSTARLAVKVIVLFPGQIEPEHWHPPVGDDPGKEETLRVVSGTVHVFIEGGDRPDSTALPKESRAYYTAGRMCTLSTAQQLTIEPGVKHWFQSGELGAVMYSFSTVARDSLDCFSDPRIVRRTKVGGGED